MPEGDAASRGCSLGQRDDFLDYRCNFHVCNRQKELSGFDAGQIQYFVDQTEQVTAAAVP